MKTKSTTARKGIHFAAAISAALMMAPITATAFSLSTATPVFAATSTRSPGDVGLIGMRDSAKSTLDSAPAMLKGGSEYAKLKSAIDEATEALKNTPSLTSDKIGTLIEHLRSAQRAMILAVNHSVTYTGNGRINYVRGYGIQVWTLDGKVVYNKNGTAKKLQHGTNWRIFGSVLNLNGSRMYNLGGDQFIDANFINFTPKK
ncbi:SLAP domain-containing protein [Lacticaseibacillus zhaodongensis]|uniref:SLAP domain-containing protein n=1 Tax=Lacticaseibacillus zhaodongensis TaxID=2668065 RepID=UPI0012D36179|nr:SLAP domain-containing protein [Lacticaseibacillus zhaodongensis]